MVMRKRRRFSWLRLIIFSLILILSIVIVAFHSFSWIVKAIYPTHYIDIVEKYAEVYNIDPYLVLSIIKNESKFNPEAVSRKDARGLMQIAPITGQWASEKLPIESYSQDMLFDPELNIQIGCWYLSILNNQFASNFELVVAAYNAGNGNVSRWLSNPEYSADGKNLDNIPFGETRIYQQRVLRDYERYKRIYE
ncbi:soluble lytic murein transglycosylase [Serpentinicella alkaliphila]|uniref:Soluble lytic murein transglycosylase n=2 Tax=Serpentinicella alkaliphila TaxID=1734049 RepID=A0A4R2TY44_9FIRM|nr:soluble lytic murein transglycosylase [Serpentinicella alkaliphila]